MKFLKNRRRRLSRSGRGVVRRLIFEDFEERSLLTLVIEPGSLVLLPDAPAPLLDREPWSSEIGGSTAERPKPDAAPDRLSYGELERDLNPAELAICLLADAGC